MYLDHFGLSRPPFKITPDTRLFYPGGSRGEILEAIVYAILDGEGIVKVVGEVGSGKTMLSRMLEIRLPDSVDIVYLANPSVAPGDVMHAITLEMGLALPSEASRLQALHLLQAELLSRHAKGRQVVCFVEEAQAMPIETLEEIRLLSNLETHQDKLLQIVLFGQPELDNNLDGPNIRQLRERIVHSFSLAPFGVNEIREYVHFRMQGAGYRGPDIFTTGAYRKMAKASLGLVRRINIIGDKALLAAYAVNSYQVGPRQVAVAVADSEFGRITRRRQVPGLAWAAGIGLLAVGLAVAGTAYVMQRPVANVVADAMPTPREPAANIATSLTGLDGEPGSGGGGVERRAMSSSAPSDVHRAAMTANANRSSAAVALTAPAATQLLSVPSAPGALAVEPQVAVEVSAPATVDAPAQAPGSPREVTANTVEPPPARQRDSGDIVANPRVAVKVSAPGNPNTIANVTVSNVPPSQGAQLSTYVPVTPPSSSGEPAGVVPAKTEGFDATTSGPKVVAVPLATMASEGVRSSRAPSMTGDIQLHSVPVGVRASELATIQPRVLENRLDATRSWLSGAPGGNFSIQLMMTHGDNWQNLEQFLLRWRPEDLASVYVYQAKIRGRTWYGVLFSEYDSLKGAQRALTSLPEELKRHKPYVRKISRISPVG